MALDTYGWNQLAPAKQTYNMSAKIRRVFFAAFACLYIHHLTLLSSVHTIYCQTVRWLLKKEMEYRHLPAGTEDNHEKSQLNSYSHSQNSNSELHEYKSVALSVLSTGSV